MLEPREADVPALFLFLVVLPLVTYILLGKWNEVSKKKARISMLAQLAAEEALRVEAMATASVAPVASLSQTSFHQCARCFSPATTRCSRCKTVRYCSGKCQIIDWRQGHKLECLQSDNNGSTSSFFASVSESFHQQDLLDENSYPLFLGSDIKESMLDNIPPETSLHPPYTIAPTTNIEGDISRVSTAGRKLSDRLVSHKFNKEILKSEDNNSMASSYEILTKHNSGGPPMPIQGRTARRSNLHAPYKLTGENGSLFESSSTYVISGSVYSEKNETGACESAVAFTPERGDFSKEEWSSSNGKLNLSSSGAKSSTKGNTRSKSSLHSSEATNAVAHRSMPKASKEYPLPGIERKACIANESSASPIIPAQGSNGISKIGSPKMASPKKLPKVPKQDTSGVANDSFKKNKVLFPYEEFVKFFHCEVLDLSPRGLLNCGNSCYANAVLQCLTCTKPLIIYLLRRSHSRTCLRDWCLMCELEQHVSMLREGGAPLSPGRILSRMQNIGCRMGGGDQEDAHEFLRLLITSMQSICLEGLGGEKEVDSRLQETTFVQQTFGGRLRSKVKCLRCHHDSERYENIMDLTLEIQGWVESLEDALTQFTAPEDLDGENMYRCGRCAAYVKARKQLSIHEAPNILTIVLKRFQTGKYGKINKCITFPDMLDMIPFMTGSGDSPPLYMLYGVVVHLDTLNASFSGHYVSYVKDLQGTWFRIDDTQVEPVPMSQVMSEGAYILFYSRSFPRPPRVYSGRTTPLQAPDSAKHCTSKTQKSSRHGQSKPNGVLLASDHSPMVPNPELNMGSRTADSCLRTTKQMYAESICMDFSDATSSDWSLFTSSDESSFTTESTRDSFSTIDYNDTLNGDPISSLFSTFCIPEFSNSSISCTKFSPSRPQTRFFSESKGLVLDSSMSTQQLGNVHKGKNPEQVSVSLSESRALANNCSMSVRYRSNPKDSFVQVQTCDCCEL
ncbi:ubiquitin-specific protease 15 isoform X2 [Tasmannia lanceolata]|uniref:ubiquitin-specific protease 15 isoform X2 n=1 Tax=Tasmannia lanceolata TaxID=3420 RepID=UPI00406450CD